MVDQVSDPLGSPGLGLGLGTNSVRVDNLGPHWAGQGWVWAWAQSLWVDKV